MAVKQAEIITVKDLLIRDYKIEEGKFDFLGLNLYPSQGKARYVLSRRTNPFITVNANPLPPLYPDAHNNLEFHHLLKRSECIRLGIKDEGYIYRNGVILTPYSHKLLHLIEVWDEPIYDSIIVQLHNIKLVGYLEPEFIIKIHGKLADFENEYPGLRSQKRTRRRAKPDYPSYSNYTNTFNKSLNKKR